MRHVFLSSIYAVPVSYFIYSSFSFYGPETWGEIPGTWFVRALTELGRSEEAVRMELYRMERDGELTSRKKGRTKFYRPTVAARAEIDAGTRKIFGEPASRWNGQWTIVQFQFESKQRVQRDRLRSLLQVEGFASIGSGVFIHPRAPSSELSKTIASFGAPGCITVFTGASLTEKHKRTFAASTWDLVAVGRRYDQFLRHFNPIAKRTASLTDKVAFAGRFALVFDFLEAAWADPELPRELLPRYWPGARARLLARTLYRRLLPSALRYANAIAES
jgi:phenylacetic acid degradation operon negative regulatory protein